MTYDNYRLIFIAAAIVCGVCFVIVVAMFFLFRIPRIISDFSGRTVRKGVQEIRERNETSGDKAYKSSPVNRMRGKVTDKIGAGAAAKKAPFSTGVTTEKISTQKLGAGQETEVLYGSGQEPEVLYSAGQETTVLYNEEQGMETQYAADYTAEAAAPYAAEGMVVIEREITFVHTQERAVG